MQLVDGSKESLKIVEYRQVIGTHADEYVSRLTYLWYFFHYPFTAQYVGCIYHVIAYLCVDPSSSSQVQGMGEEGGVVFNKQAFD